MQKSSTQLDKEILNLYETQYLAAVKLYKEETGADLKASKEYVDSLAASRGLKKKGCFIATACYSDYNSVEVVALQKFRDEKLLTNAAGRIFVKIYYAISPPLALRLENSNTSRRFIRKYILTPIVNTLSGSNRH